MHYPQLLEKYPFYVTLQGNANQLTNNNTFSIAVDPSAKSFTYATSVDNKTNVTTSTVSTSTTFTPRSSALSVQVPANADSFDSYATQANAVLTSLFNPTGQTLGS